MNKPLFYLLIILFFGSLHSCRRNNPAYPDRFRLVWETVRDSFYEPEMKGLDWENIREEYESSILSAESDSAFYAILNQMLFELRRSHLGVVPNGAWPFVEPTMFAGGSLGIAVRYIDGEVTITRVDSASPAEISGLRPGYRIQSIDGQSISQIIDERLKSAEPPSNRKYHVSHEINSRIFGDPNTKVLLEYSEFDGTVHTKEILRDKVGELVDLGIGMPPCWSHFEARLLSENIGYIQFNWFSPMALREFFNALDGFRNSKGIIVDLRGNPGGIRQVAIRIAGLLVDSTTLCGIDYGRSEKEEIFLTPLGNGYRGEVVILIDVMTKSSAEWFAAILQSIGRATVLGEHSPGSVGPAKIVELDDGATLIYPYAESRTSDDVVIEGRGVIPDIEVDYNLDDVINGTDNQLERAVEYLLRN